MEDLEGHIDGMIESEENLEAIKEIVENDVITAFKEWNEEMSDGV
jgi:hypothetical protein